jgi:hypothetical protein
MHAVNGKERINEREIAIQEKKEFAKGWWARPGQRNLVSWVTIISWNQIRASNTNLLQYRLYTDSRKPITKISDIEEPRDKK